MTVASPPLFFFTIEGQIAFINTFFFGMYLIKNIPIFYKGKFRILYIIKNLILKSLFKTFHWESTLKTPKIAIASLLWSHYFASLSLHHYFFYWRKNFSTFFFVLHVSPVAEFSVSISNTPKFICSLDDGAPRLLITENDASFKIESITYFKVKGK